MDDFLAFQEEKHQAIKKIQDLEESDKFLIIVQHKEETENEEESFSVSYRSSKSMSEPELVWLLKFMEKMIFDFDVKGESNE
jgi:hypothetical protein